MQAAFGEYKFTKLFHELFAFDESLTPSRASGSNDSTNSVSNRYVYPVCPACAGPSIVPNLDSPAFRGIQWPRQGGAGLSLRGPVPLSCLSGALVEWKKLLSGIDRI